MKASVFIYRSVKCSFMTSSLNMAIFKYSEIVKGAKEIWIHCFMYSSQNHLLRYQKCFNLLYIVFLSAMSLPFILLRIWISCPSFSTKASIPFRFEYHVDFCKLHSKICNSMLFAENSVVLVFNSFSFLTIQWIQHTKINQSVQSTDFEVLLRFWKYH